MPIMKVCCRVFAAARSQRHSCAWYVRMCVHISWGHTMSHRRRYDTSYVMNYVRCHLICNDRSHLRNQFGCHLSSHRMQHLRTHHVSHLMRHHRTSTVMRFVKSTTARIIACAISEAAPSHTSSRLLLAMLLHLRASPPRRRTSTQEIM